MSESTEKMIRERIEFHDSNIVAIFNSTSSTHLLLDAYVHRWEKIQGRWKGRGWIRPVQIIISGASLEKPPSLPVALWGGKIRTNQLTYDNLLELPFVSSAATTLRLELVTGAIIDLNGRDIAIEPTGSGHYVEQLPDEFQPHDYI